MVPGREAQGRQQDGPSLWCQPPRAAQRRGIGMVLIPQAVVYMQEIILREHLTFQGGTNMY